MAIYPPRDILFYRVFISASAMLLVSIGLRRKVWVENRRLFTALPAAHKKGLLFQLFGGGLLLTANWFFFIYVTNEVSIKAAALAYLVCPVLTTVLAWLLLRERLTPGQWVAVLLSAAGCGMLAFFPAYHGPTPQESRFYILITVIAVFLTILPLWLNLFALKQLKSSTVGILLYINPVFGFVLALSVYGEKVDRLQLVAYGVIVLAVVIFNWFNPVLRARLQE